MVNEEGSLPVLTALSHGVPEVVDTPQQLDQAIAALSSSNVSVAIDTERAQGYRYDASAWLVQIRRQDVGTFLIDSHALPDLSALGQVLDSTWIFHAASQDLPCLADVGLVPQRIFDTEIAARLLGVESFSLRGVCETTLGVTLEKAHQNENWSVRPLPREWLRYAAMDVEVLPELEEKLTQALHQASRWDWAVEEFEYERTHLIVPKENRWENLKGLGRVRRPKDLAIARELWEAREKLAQEHDLSPSRILSSKGIIAASLKDPQTRRSLQSLAEFRRPRPRQYTDVWWSAIQAAHGLTTEELPQIDRETPPGEIPALRMWKRLRPQAVDRLQAMRAVVGQAATPLEISPDVLLEPKAQRFLTWEPLALDTRGGAQLDRLAFDERLRESSARPWQRKIMSEALTSLPAKRARQLAAD